MKTYKRIPRLPAAAMLALLIGLFLSGLAFTAAPAAAAPMAADQPVLPQPEEIDWTSDVPLCAPGYNPNNEHCGADSAEWPGFTAPAAGTITIDVCAVDYHTDDGNQFLDYSTSWGTQGFVHAHAGSNDCDQYTLTVEAGEHLSASFSHPPTGGKGGSVKAGVYGHYEPAPLPIDPVCQSLGVVPASGYAPLSVRFGGQWSDPDSLVASAIVRTGDGGSVELAEQATGASYIYETPGEFEAELVLIGHDGREFSSESCKATVEAVEPPVLEFDVQVGASCENQALAGWVRGYASQEATLQVAAKAFGNDLTLTRQVGPGAFEFTAEKDGIEGLVEVTINATMVYQDGVVAEDHYSAVLDCGMPPAPEPGSCVSADVSVTNVPDEGQWVSVTATGIGINAYVEVDGSIVGGPVVVENGQAVFNIFVKPGNRVSILFEGEDGLVHSSPACHIVITGMEVPKCGNGPSKLDVVAFIDTDNDNYLDEGEEIVGGGDWGFQLQTAQLHYMAARHDWQPEWRTLEQGTLIRGVAVMHPLAAAYEQGEPTVWVKDRSPLDGMAPYHFYPGSNREHGYWVPFSSLFVDRQAGVLRVERCDDIIIAIALQQTTDEITIAAHDAADTEQIYQLNADGVYVVQAGDTVWSIATAFGQSMTDVLSWNGFEYTPGQPVVISIGQTLVVTPPAG